MIRLLLLCVLLFPVKTVANSGKVADNSTIVFVCEHGSAKSVVAAAYFNHLAQQHALHLHAVSRGTTPDLELSPAVVEGLRKDQISLPSDKPSRLTSTDASSALKVVSFCELSDDIKARNVERWEVPPISEDYAKARDAIVKKVQELIQRLKIKEQK
jgi:arsenate reductase